MAVGAFLEPLVVVSLLFGGAFFNRNKDYSFRQGSAGWAGEKGLQQQHLKKSDDVSPQRLSADSWSESSTPTLSPDEQSAWRRRKLQVFGYKKLVATPNTLVFKDRFLSRVLYKFPFLTEAWYWALIYWVS